MLPHVIAFPRAKVLVDLAMAEVHRRRVRRSPVEVLIENVVVFPFRLDLDDEYERKTWWSAAEHVPALSAAGQFEIGIDPSLSGADGMGIVAREYQHRFDKLLPE